MIIRLQQMFLEKIVGDETVKTVWNINLEALDYKM